MAGDEQRVRTMAGWIGVEISKSRVRTAGKAGYGLYRVRGSVGHRTRAELDALIEGAVTPDGAAERCPWTAYMFTLGEIEMSIEMAIKRGIPLAPCDLWLAPADGGAPVGVTTRWTQAYRGRRDLGARKWAHGAHEAPALGAGLVDGTGTGPCLTMLVRIVDRMGERGRHLWYDELSYVTRRDDPTPRQQQREQNAAFQREHLVRREHGLRARHTAKIGRMEHRPERLDADLIGHGACVSCGQEWPCAGFTPGAQHAENNPQRSAERP